MAKNVAKSPAGERRVALEERRRVAEMSPEEMRRELLTSEVTGLPNRRAFDEAGRAAAVAMSDVDGLKALNNLGMTLGTPFSGRRQTPCEKQDLRRITTKAMSFCVEGTALKTCRPNLERARAILRDRTVIVQRTDGRSLSFTGADFSYGVGKDINEAESVLKRHKAQREARGEIARGELRGIIITRCEADTPDAK